MMFAMSLTTVLSFVQISTNSCFLFIDFINNVIIEALL